MHYIQTIIAASACIASAYAATTHTVTVGGPGAARTFSPQAVNAAVGDTVKFLFTANNHTVTSGGGSTGAACQPNGKFNSGFLPVAAGQTNNLPTFSVQVANTNPMPFYCAQNQADHCQAGMVGVINPSADNNNPNSLVQIQRAAAKTTVSGVAKGVNGGTVGKQKRDVAVAVPFEA